MRYQHTQNGYVILIALLAVAILFGIILTQIGLNLPIIAFMIFILFILASFGYLHVTVDEQCLGIKFGYLGIFRKQFPLDEIISAKTVRNHWYYGWGVRWWPHMWIYNVSGFDAIEIVMKSSKRYRIGTDEPEALEQAILKAIKGSSKIHKVR